MNKHGTPDAVEVLEEDLDTVDKGVDSSCFRFRGLVLRTKLSVFFDTIESQGLVEQTRIRGVDLLHVFIRMCFFRYLSLWSGTRSR